MPWSGGAKLAKPAAHCRQGVHRATCGIWVLAQVWVLAMSSLRATMRMGIDCHLEAQVAQRRQRRESPRHGSQVRPRARHLRGCTSGFTVKDVCSSQSRQDKTASEERDPNKHR